MATFSPGSAVRPGEYSAGGYRVTIAANGSLLVRAGDSISKYAKCLYGDARVGWSDFGRLEAGRAKPLSNPNLIHTGETLFHIPTFQSAGDKAAAGATVRNCTNSAIAKGVASPRGDGDVQEYQAAGARGSQPKIVYVNGMQTSGCDHAETAVLLSEITERTVTGVYNATGGKHAVGMVIDLLQCFDDWKAIVTAQLLEFGDSGINRIVDRLKQWSGRGSSDPARVGNELRKLISDRHRVAVFRGYLGRLNPATASLFDLLVRYPGQRIFIVAHSQGNLVTSGALWALQAVSGPSALANLQIYSLASPSPAWPEGINFRIKVYGHTNDLVPFADPKALVRRNRNQSGDWRKLGSQSVGLGDRHDVAMNMLNSNFAKRIRSDIGVDPMPESLIKDQSLPYRGPGSKK